MENIAESGNSYKFGMRFNLPNEGFAAKAQAIIENDLNGTYRRFRNLASRIFDMPFSVMSLASSNSQILRVQMDDKTLELPRENSFCGYVLDSSEVLIVQNAIEDSRFAQNSIVRESMHIRFYAGVPLVGANGEVFGTLCVMDRKQREYDESKIAIHKDLARQIVDHVEIELSNQALAKGLSDRKESLHAIMRNLKGPLSSLISLSGELRDRSQANATQEFDSLVALLGKYADTAYGVVDGIESEGCDIGLSLEDEVEKIFTLFSEEAKSKRIRLISKIGKNIDVRVDRSVIATLLSKTIFKCIKYSLNGGEVSVEAWKSTRYVLISVSDSGVGMHSEKVQSILAGSSGDTGSMLDLSMCRRLLESNDGHLDIISEAGMGTTVSLSFPC